MGFSSLGGMKGATGSMAGRDVGGGYKQGQMQNFTPQQMELFKQMFGAVGPDSYTSRLAGGDQSMFEEMERPAMQQFNQLQGNLASRFSGMGSGARKSSGFQNTINSATQDFASGLQSRRQELQRNAIRELQGMSSDLLNQKPYENFLIKPEEKQSFWQKFMGGALPLAGAAAGGFFGGPAGMAIGSQLGSAAGSAFSGGGNSGMNFQGIGSLPTSWNQNQQQPSHVRLGSGSLGGRAMGGY